MSLSARLRKLENMTIGSDEIKIKVSRPTPEEWTAKKQLFDAKRVLGLLTPQQIRRTIFVSRSTGDMEDEARVPMTREQAREILNNQMEATA